MKIESVFYAFRKWFRISMRFHGYLTLASREYAHRGSEEPSFILVLHAEILTAMKAIVSMNLDMRPSRRSLNFRRMMQRTIAAKLHRNGQSLNWSRQVPNIPLALVVFSSFDRKWHVNWLQMDFLWTNPMRMYHCTPMYIEIASFRYVFEDARSKFLYVECKIHKRSNHIFWFYQIPYQNWNPHLNLFYIFRVINSRIIIMHA